jgi:NTP pyrophosphatase (non-canonical NTP hydrolase)
MKETINKVLDWGHEVGILSIGTIEKQADKVVEEAKELKESVLSGDIRNIELELGDVAITVILEANMCGLSLQKCIEKALHKNINRPKGKMKDGQYVRDK